MRDSLREVQKLTKDLTILYVEDEKEQRESTAEILEILFDEVLTAEDGIDGIKRYETYLKERERYPDIVLTDIRMPRLDGVEMSREIHRKNPLQQIVIFTAYPQAEYYHQMIDTGVTAFTLKPLSLPDLYQAFIKAAKAIKSERRLINYGIEAEKRLRERTRELTHQIYYDGLSRLRNRKALLEEMERSGMAALMLINIDSFSMINDLYGMETGNSVISKFASLLEGFASEYGYEAFRLNSDEFVLFHPVQMIDTERYYQDIQRFLKACESYKIEIAMHDDIITLDVTIGLAFGTDELLPHADMALRYARKEHRKFATYSSVVDNKEKTQQLLEWKKRLKTALAEDRIVPLFQPIVDGRGEIDKYEVLMRLKEGKVLITPWYFLESAFKTRLYRDLSQRIISKAITLLIEREDLYLSINISYLDMNEKIFLLWLEEAFVENPNLAQRITFEIVESEIIEEHHHMVNFTQLARKYGAKIAIDDFGSGFSNFSYILQLRPDYLKIDGSLVKKIDTDADSRILVETIVRFAKALQITVVAEFVHNEAVFSILKEMEVDLYQGYYFSEPLLEI